MIGSLLNLHGKPDEKSSENPAFERQPAAESEDALIAALPVAEKIIVSRGYLLAPTEKEDLRQTIALRLIKWRSKYLEKGAAMSPGEWLSFTARTTFNEINRLLAKRNAKGEILVADFPELTAADQIEGETETEVRSLTIELWRNMQKLSVKQRQALLLGNKYLLSVLKRLKIDDREICEWLGIGSEWQAIKLKIPLGDAEIAALLQRNGEEAGKTVEQLTGSIKKARHDARLKLRRLSGYE